LCDSPRPMRINTGISSMSDFFQSASAAGMMRTHSISIHTAAAVLRNSPFLRRAPSASPYLTCSVCGSLVNCAAYTPACLDGTLSLRNVVVTFSDISPFRQHFAAGWRPKIGLLATIGKGRSLAHFKNGLLATTRQP